MLGLTAFDDDLYYASLARIGRFRFHRAAQASGTDANQIGAHAALQILNYALLETLRNVASPTNEPSLRNKEKWFALGLASERGFGQEHDPVAAAACYRKSAALGCAEADYRLGFLLEMGISQPQAHETVEACYRRAAKHGSQQALCALGQRALFRSIPTNDPAKSLACFAKAREDEWNVPWTYCGFLDDCFTKGRTVDTDALADYYRYDLMPGTSDLGNVNHWIHGGDDMRVRLARFLQSQGIAKGTVFLSWCRMLGRLLPKDISLGTRYAEDSAADGNPHYLHYLAWVHLQQPDKGGANQAIDCLERAGAAGYEVAVRDLQLLGRKGLLDPDALQAVAQHLPVRLRLSAYGFVDGAATE